jgi:DNA polymerase II small subunit/DNA polymerase delta subunit B
MTEQSQDKLDKILNKHNITQSELELILKQTTKPKINTHNQVEHNYSGKHLKIGIVSDLHLGHKKLDMKCLDDCINIFNKKCVDAIYCPGDIIEGMSNREGHYHELNVLGVSNQLDYATEVLDKFKKNFYFILGNHDLWSMNKSNQGVHIGKELERRLSNVHYLGDMVADIKLNNNIKMRLTHEGNSAYALSYSLQKRINALEGGNKPNILLNGHLHKFIYMFYRNIHAFECGTLERQTDFMAMKGSPAHVGFLELDIWYDKNSIKKLQPTFYPYY